MERKNNMSEKDKVINMATGEVVVNLCGICAFEIVDEKCPNEVNHASHLSGTELPPLGVFVSEKVGAVSKPGK